MFSFEDFPELKTERLILRQANIDSFDLSAVFELRSNEKINKFIATKRVQNIEEAKDFILTCKKLYNNKKRIFWLIEFNKKIIGSIVLHNIYLDKNYAEIGYKLATNYHQKGLMSEAIERVINFSFQEIKLKTIEAFTHKNNSASITLLEKHSFIFQPEKRDASFKNNRIFKLINAS